MTPGIIWSVALIKQANLRTKAEACISFPNRKTETEIYTNLTKFLQNFIYSKMVIYVFGINYEKVMALSQLDGRVRNALKIVVFRSHLNCLMKGKLGGCP